MLSKKASSVMISKVKKVLGYTHKNLPITYLGCPLYEGRLRDCIFEELILKVQNRIAAWENKHLSIGGRIILLKSIINSMPIYLFHTLQPPGCTLRKLERTYNSFLWGTKSDHKTIHWRCWDKLCYPRDEGGLGFRLPMDSAFAFAMKLWWRFRSCDCLWATFMKMRYGRNRNAQAMEAKRQDSNCWKRMCKAKAIAEDNIIWSIGAGNLSLWHDIWMNGERISDLLPHAQHSQCKVADYILQDKWNVSKLAQVFPSPMVQTIKEISINKVDQAYWKGSKNMNFSTKGAWSLIRQFNEPKEIFKRLWHNTIPLRTSVLAWRILNGLLPIDNIMKKRFGVALPSKCQCCFEEESMEHVFLSSPIAILVWNYFNAYFNLPNPLPSSVQGLLSTWFYSHDWVRIGHIRNLIPILILYNLWIARNDSKHNQYCIQPQRIIVLIEQQIWNLIKAGIIKAENCRGEGIFCKKFEIVGQLKIKERIIIFQWIKPAMDWVKLNIDGSSRGNPGPAAAGGILRDHTGSVLFTFLWPLGSQSAYVAELAAAKEGLQICQQRGISKVWIESDSMLLVDHINNNSVGNWQTFPYLCKIRSYLQSMDWRCSHIWREGNQAADHLANRGIQALAPRIEFAPLLQGRLKGIVTCDASGLMQIRSSSRPSAWR